MTILFFSKGFTSDLDNGIDSMETLLKKNKIWAADINQNDPNFFNGSEIFLFFCLQ